MWREEIGVVQRQMAGDWTKVLVLQMLSAASLLFRDLDSYLVDSQSGLPRQSFESFPFTPVSLGLLKSSLGSLPML